MCIFSQLNTNFKCRLSAVCQLFLMTIICTALEDNTEHNRPGTSFVLLYLRSAITAGDSHEITSLVIDGTVCSVT